jgi:universal stress protein A
MVLAQAISMDGWHVGRWEAGGSTSGSKREICSMFQKILVPVDLSDRHQAAIDIAADLASESGGEVTLLHVIEVIPGLWEEVEQSFYTRVERMARDHMAKLGRPLQERMVPRREEIVYGNRAREIVRYAVEMGVDLIVLTSHRIGVEDPGAGWGTVSYKVSILAQCPVLLVK